MKQIVNVPFEAAMTINLPDGTLAQVLRQVGKDIHYVIRNSSSFTAKPIGTVFNVEFEKRGDREIPPPQLREVWTGPIVDSARPIRLIYLAELFLVVLKAPKLATAPVKNYDPAVVFANPELVLLEALYNSIHASTPAKKEKLGLHVVLKAEDYRYVRKSVYTRFALTDGEEVQAYGIPRTMNYFPEVKTISAAYTMVSPNQLPENMLPEHIGKKISGTALHVQRFFQNTGWKNLTEIMQEDPSVRGIVRQFAASGFIKPNPNM